MYYVIFKMAAHIYQNGDSMTTEIINKTINTFVIFFIISETAKFRNENVASAMFV